MASTSSGRGPSGCGTGGGRGASGRRGADHRHGRTPAQARRHPRPGDRRAHGGGGTRQTAPHRRRAAVREIDGHNRLRPYYHCRRAPDGKWFLRRAEERMARYGKEHKQATRQRIIENGRPPAQARRHRRLRGRPLMADAGLTNGAFYAHFPSKEDLVATAVAGQLREQRKASARWRPAAPESSSTCVNTFVQHRDNPADGCPSAALPDRSPAARHHPAGFRRRPARHHRRRRRPPRGARSGLGAREDAQHLHPDAGTLQSSRALADRRLAEQVLEQGVPGRPRAAGRRATALTRRARGPKP